MENRIKFDLLIPNDILEINEAFIKNGYKLFIVGGAVRDSYLRKLIKDYDLATDATPDKVEELMKGINLRTIPTGKAFGVINVFTKTDEYEIATFRSDISYTDGRRPDSVEFTTIEGDVKRRDLTINALFYDIETGEIVDLVGGIDDLNDGIIRTVGNAEDRFNEDRLRILRVLRFASRLDFKIHSDIEATLHKDSKLTGVSSERIRDEFLKGLASSKNVLNFLNMAHSFNLLEQIFGGFKINTYFRHETSPAVQIALLLVNNKPEDVSVGLNKLKYTLEENKSVTFLLKLLDFNSDSIYQYKKLHDRTNLTRGEIIRFANLTGLDFHLIKSLIKFDLTVTGLEAEMADIPKGIEMGKWIKDREVDKFKTFLTIKDHN